MVIKRSIRSRLSDRSSVNRTRSQVVDFEILVAADVPGRLMGRAAVLPLISVNGCSLDRSPPARATFLHFPLRSGPAGVPIPPTVVTDRRSGHVDQTSARLVLELFERQVSPAASGRLVTGLGVNSHSFRRSTSCLCPSLSARAWAFSDNSDQVASLGSFQQGVHQAATILHVRGIHADALAFIAGPVPGQL